MALIKVVEEALDSQLVLTEHHTKRVSSNMSDIVLGWG